MVIANNAPLSMNAVTSATEHWSRALASSNDTHCARGNRGSSVSNSRSCISSLRIANTDGRGTSAPGPLVPFMIAKY